MNQDHALLCSSPEWAEHIAETVLPAAIGALTLGDQVLEIGPGYGASTKQLADNVPSLTAVEVDETLAKELAEAYPNVTVVQGSGDNLPFDAGRFSAVVCFTMLHHVLTQEMQDGLFAEARRVLRPGGLFAGSDSIDNEGWRDLHGGDTCTPVDPGGLPHRLTSAGFVDVDVRVVEADHWFTFSARTRHTSKGKPAMTLPFEEPLTKREPGPRVIPEPPRRGEAGGPPCSVCPGEDNEHTIWSNRHWILNHGVQTSLPGAVWLTTREHCDSFGDLPAERAREFGELAGRIDRAILSLSDVARVHLYRWGDGGAHFHVWFLPRPLGMLEAQKHMLPLWEEALPEASQDAIDEAKALIAKAMGSDDG